MTVDAIEQPRTSTWRSLLINRVVIRALILRELQSRYGRYNIGFLWLVAEPLMLASIVTLLHAVQHTKSAGSSSFEPYAFTVTGYCFLMIFRSNFGRAPGALNSAMPLMYHSQITPVDVMLARATTDTLGALSAYTLLMGVGILLGLAEWPVRPLYTFLAIAEFAVWSFGLALVVAAYSHKFHALHNFVPPVNYFSLPLSGAFFTMSFLPVGIRDYMTWNPMTGMFETARFGQFETASPDYMFHGYVIAHCAVSLYWGLLAINRARHDIHVA